MQEWNIDKNWEKNVEILCPNIPPEKKFHTYTLYRIGINMCIFSFPLGSFIARRILKTHKYEEENLKNRSYVNMAMIILISVSLDYFFSKVWPVIIFGTAKLDVVEGLIYKKLFLWSFFGIFCNGFFGYLFVPKIK